MSTQEWEEATPDGWAFVTMTSGGAPAVHARVRETEAWDL